MGLKYLCNNWKWCDFDPCLHAADKSKGVGKVSKVHCECESCKFSVTTLCAFRKKEIGKGKILFS